MDLVKCFWMEPTDQVEVSLRRYRHGAVNDCPHYPGYHDASRFLARGPKTKYPDFHGDWLDHNDPAWPTHCKCGYKFAETDHWQCNPDELLRRVDTGELFTAHTAPAGAMRHASWQIGFSRFKLGEDGIMLAVKLPDGTWWTVDGPAFKDGKYIEGGWKRSGTVPNVTAMPSIDTGTYHGWLANGYLRKC
jgi:hypothetical protein